MTPGWMRHLRFGLCTAAWLGGTLAAPPVRADDAACLDAATKGQRFRDTHKLVEAREKLRMCAAAECPPVVQADCAGWLASVEKALPSVVLTASDEAGASWIDVAVTVDGRPFATRLDGQAVPIDPGPHMFRFDTPDGSTVKRVEVIPEGEQNHSVHVLIARKPSSPPESVPALEPPPAGPPPPASSATPQPSDRGTSQRTIGLVTGSLGIAALGASAIFGWLANTAKNKYLDDCGSSIGQPAGKCNSEGIAGHSDAITKAGVSTALFIGGGVGIATGAVLFLAAPRGTKAPVLGLAPGQLFLQERF